MRPIAVSSIEIFIKDDKAQVRSYSHILTYELISTHTEKRMGMQGLEPIKALMPVCRHNAGFKKAEETVTRVSTETNMKALKSISW